jgi:glyoxylase-like metal-dependent hydrolase (beta-lactamase superfamily II)
VLELLDLEFLGAERAIGVYIVETSDGPALFDCGPATTVPRLHEALSEHGLTLTDIRHLLVSHIHLDHAGAAGTLVREHPELTVWVSEIGAPHLAAPERLERSARRLYGDNFDTYWGELAPVPEQNIRIASGDVLGWETFPAPGHASHHVAYFRDGTLLAGDACGIRPQPANYILPLAPPPDIDLEAWHTTLDEIAWRAPERLALTHFGIETAAPDHLERLSVELDRWAELVHDGMSEEDFIAATRPQAGEDAPALFDPVNSFGQSWQGLRRYWDKRAEALSAG